MAHLIKGRSWPAAIPTYSTVPLSHRHFRRNSRGTGSSTSWSRLAPACTLVPSSVRSRLIGQRTAVANQLRSIAREYGVNFPVGYRALRREVPCALEACDNELSATARVLLSALQEELGASRTNQVSLKSGLYELTHQYAKLQFWA